MSDPNQDEMRRKRLARLAKLEGGPAAASPALEATSPVTDSGGEPSKTIKSPEKGLVSPPVNMDTSSSLNFSSKQGPSASQSVPKSREKESPEAMEVGSLKGCASQVSLDFDSGIENMDVDEKKESPTKRNRTTSSANYEVSEEALRSAIQNILNISLPGTDGTARAASLSCPAASQMLEAAQMTAADPNLISLVLSDICAQLSSNLPPEKVIKFLLDIYKRSHDEEASLGRRASVPPLSDIIVSIRSQCVSYVSLYLEGGWQDTPTPYNYSPLYAALQAEESPSALIPALIITLHKDLSRFDAVFSPLLNHCLNEMSRMKLTDEKCSQPLLVLRKLVEVRLPSGERPVCDLVVKLSQWLPEGLGPSAGLQLATTSFLGAFLAPSVFPEEDTGIVDKYFKDKISSTQVKTIAPEYQKELDFLRSQQHAIVHCLVVNPSSREEALKFMAKLLNINSKRQQLQAAERMNAGDGFMLNLLSVMQFLCSKVRMDKVDPNYIHSDRCRFELTDEARLKNSSQEAQEFCEAQAKANGPSKEPNFPTEIWFLTLYAHHICIQPILRRYTRRLRHLRELQQRLDELEKSEPAWKNHPSAQRNKQIIKTLKHQIKKQSRSRACADIGLLDQTLFTRCMNFYSSAAEHMLRFFDPVTPLQPRVPFAAEPNPLFAMLPEWVVDDIADFLLFGVQFLPWVVSSSLDDPMLTWLLACLAHPQYFTNPFLVSKLVEVLFVVNPAVQEKTTVIYTRIMSHPICEEFLPSALMRFYTDVEQTGSSNEFYEKFTTRYHISIIMKSMWESAVHKIAIVSESKNGKQFVRFINMMMNDTTFLLDESLSALTRIHEVQEDMADPAKWAAQDQETRSSRHRQLNTDERQCRSYLTLARETVDMFHYLTEGVQETFLRPELADRLAAMLDAVLEQLTNGPKCRNLKVKNPEKYGWEPKWLLSHIIDIYLHLACDKMAQAMANDERSFKIETFQDAIKRMESTLNRAQPDIDKFKALFDQANALVIERQQQEDSWENVPEEFEDAVMGEIMEDPVTLPTSGKVMDRKHIIRHILSTPNDPFNRQPLTEDQLVPATDLRNKIQQWKKEQKQKVAARQ
jgi:ubiquitin conjugation factor E4 B